MMPLMRVAIGFALFICFELLALVVVYGCCRLLAFIGMTKLVFPAWLIGVPIGFLLALGLSLWIAARFG